MSWEVRIVQFHYSHEIQNEKSVSIVGLIFHKDLKIRKIGTKNDNLTKSLNKCYSLRYPRFSFVNPLKGPVDPFKGPVDPLKGRVDPLKSFVDPVKGPVDPLKGFVVDPLKGLVDPLKSPADLLKGPCRCP